MRFPMFCRWLSIALLSVFAPVAVWASPPPAHGATAVDNALLTHEPTGAHWAGYGRTFDEQRFSPLKQIDTGNISRLGLAWTLDLPDVPSVTTVPLAVQHIEKSILGCVQQQLARLAVNGQRDEHHVHR